MSIALPIRAKRLWKQQASCSDCGSRRIAMPLALFSEPPTGKLIVGRKDQAMSLLKWALIFLLVALVAGLFGFTGIAAASADIARILFYIFVAIFLVLLILSLMGRGKAGL